VLRCASLGSLDTSSGQGMQVLPAADIVRRLGLTGSDAARVRAGAVVFAGPAPDSTAQVDLGGTAQAPTITFAMAHGQAEGDGPLTLTDQPSTVELPVVTVARSALGHVFDDANSAALVPSETAHRLAWTTTPLAVLLEAPDRAITAEEQQRLTEGLDDDVLLVIERGYAREDGVLILIALSIVTLLILVATLSATALAQAEAAPYLGTLAAVGATKRTRRALAAAQAATTAAIGSLVGVVLGLAPGVAIAIPLTSGSDGVGNPTAPVIVVPWLTMGVLLVAVPTIAAALAWVAIRRSPVVTRRTT
jgi:putative ABC transport system permease protein